MTTPDLFPVTVSRKPDPIPEAPDMPYFIAAYWPHGNYWKVFPEMYCEPQHADVDIAELHRRGWRNVTLLRLPESLWRVEA